MPAVVSKTLKYENRIAELPLLCGVFRIDRSWGAETPWNRYTRAPNSWSCMELAQCCILRISSTRDFGRLVRLFLSQLSVSPNRKHGPVSRIGDSHGLLLNLGGISYAESKGCRHLRPHLPASDIGDNQNMVEPTSGQSSER